jgi:hypothetical protein
MLAYVFWHAPAAADDGYERRLSHFHGSLRARPPVGFVRSLSFRCAALPWLDGAPVAYEDWYVIEDFAALGVLNEAAVGRGHRTAHDDVARHAGSGAGGVYRLVEGDCALEAARIAVWVSRPPGVEDPVLGALLGDGLDPACAGVWQRQLVLGPAPEWCVLAAEEPDGVHAGRLAAGWSAESGAREVVV